MLIECVRVGLTEHTVRVWQADVVGVSLEPLATRQGFLLRPRHETRPDCGCRHLLALIVLRLELEFCSLAEQIRHTHTRTSFQHSSRAQEEDEIDSSIPKYDNVSGLVIILGTTSIMTPVYKCHKYV